MNLVVQGQAVEPAWIDRIAALTHAQTINQSKPGVWRLVNASPADQLDEVCAAARLDHAWVASDRSLDDYRLFVTDMDSTLINIECIDEVADMQGFKHEVSEITEAAMRGDLDFSESLLQRVSLLKGLPEAALEQVFSERLQLNPGAERLMRELKARGIYTVLVSGGFTFFTERLKNQLGFDEAHANVLEIENGRLTGRVSGPIVDAAAKLGHLERVSQMLACTPDQVIAAGDGANDLPMIKAAGFGVAWRAKPVLRSAASCCIDHVGLDGIVDFLDD